MSNAYFAFRQFSIRQDRCAMKVSSDACIFGAWTPVPDKAAARILDIGAGTGLLSLMLAQRHETARIDAIELDAAAALQAAENCADSIFANRVRVIAGDARLFDAPERYELIVSNPPFFQNSLKGPDATRNAARHDESLDLTTLFEIVSRLLTADGTFALLMPADSEAMILKTAADFGLHCQEQLIIQGTPSATSKRGCWLFRRNHVDAMKREVLVVKIDNSYSPAFRALLGSYYLLL